MQKFNPSAALATAEPTIATRVSMKDEARALAQHCAKYRAPSTWRGAFQIANTAVPFLALLAGMIWLAEHAWWLTLLLTIPLGGLVVRFFIIQHDCGHGSFFSSRRWNDAVGRIMSVLTFTPYGLWRRIHAMHHATSGNLDRRGAGDIETLTVEEYLSRPYWARLRYRIYRHPLFLFFLGIPAYFLFLQRWPWAQPVPAREAWASVVGLDLALALVYGSLALLIGFKVMLLITLPTVICASVVGGWLFFVQHQFERTAWAKSGDWDFQLAAIHGSSHLALSPVLNWFTGSIGLHHLHHLNSMIPNYRLAECHRACPPVGLVNRLTLRESFGCARLTLWDEAQQRLIGFRDLSDLSRRRTG